LTSIVNVSLSVPYIDKCLLYRKCSFRAVPDAVPADLLTVTLGDVMVPVVHGALLAL
jgi:hypothetical protein